MNCFAGSVHIAGTVRTQSTSLASNPLIISLLCRWFSKCPRRYLILFENTFKAGIKSPFSPSNIKSLGISNKYRNFIRTNNFFLENNIKNVLNTFIMCKYIIVFYWFHITFWSIYHLKLLNIFDLFLISYKIQSSFFSFFFLKYFGSIFLTKYAFQQQVCVNTYNLYIRGLKTFLFPFFICAFLD